MEIEKGAVVTMVSPQELKYFYVDRLGASRAVNTLFFLTTLESKV